MSVATRMETGNVLGAAPARRRPAAAPVEKTHRPFLNRKLLNAWREQLILDRQLTDVARSIGIRISHLIGNDEGFAFPSGDTLADGICKRSALKKATRQLQDRGHLTVKVSHGRGLSNQYYPVMKGAQP